MKIKMKMKKCVMLDMRDLQWSLLVYGFALIDKKGVVTDIAMIEKVEIKKANKKGVSDARI